MFFMFNSIKAAVRTLRPREKKPFRTRTKVLDTSTKALFCIWIFCPKQNLFFYSFCCRRLSASPAITAPNAAVRFSLGSPAVPNTLHVPWHQCWPVQELWTTAKYIIWIPLIIKTRFLARWQHSAVLRRVHHRQSYPVCSLIWMWIDVCSCICKYQRILAAQPSISSIHINPYMSPYTDSNNQQCKTPLSCIAQTSSFVNPIGNRCSLTPQTICTELSVIEFDEHLISESVLEFFWSDQIR